MYSTLGLFMPVSPRRDPFNVATSNSWLHRADRVVLGVTYCAQRMLPSGPELVQVAITVTGRLACGELAVGTSSGQPEGNG